MWQTYVANISAPMPDIFQPHTSPGGSFSLLFLAGCLCERISQYSRFLRVPDSL